MKHKQLLIFIMSLIGLFIGCTANRNMPLSCTDEEIRSAIFDGDQTKVLNCLKAGFPVSGNTNHPNEHAFWAIMQNQKDILQLLINYGLDVNYDWGFEGGNLLTNATQLGHIEIVRLLLENGASTYRDPQNGRTPLYSSIAYGKKEIKMLLLIYGAQFNSWDKEAFRSLEENGIKYE